MNIVAIFGGIGFESAVLTGVHAIRSKSAFLPEGHYIYHSEKAFSITTFLPKFQVL